MAFVFGGIPAARSGPWPTDTWQTARREWERVSTDGPPGRGRAALVYDSRRRQIVLFGGVSAPPGPNQPQTFLDDTWIWEGRVGEAGGGRTARTVRARHGVR